jgi:hypothetical protein
MKILPSILYSLLLLATSSAAASAAALSLKDTVSTPSDFPIVVNGRATEILVDKADAETVRIAADLLAGDVERVSGVKPEISSDAAVAGQTSPVILAGTLGKSALMDKLAAEGKLTDLQKIKGRWEATLWQIVEHPFPGVERAFVIAGSDRRGTAYGLMHLSETIGVSPWYWWADVPPAHRTALIVNLPEPEIDAPAVKYRGIFINDEDWGLNEWTRQTFEAESKGVGPKTYEKVFELMLRLRLNYIWPAMHACSPEFASFPENITLADKYGIVAGSSHCEPMLCNNVHWDQKAKGPWNYSTNRDAIHSYWEENVKSRSTEEAVWALGIRGIHDAPMQTPPKDMPGKLSLMSEILKDQRALLDQYVTKQWGPVAQDFVPYKEVLAIYDAGLKVPDNVTIVWVDDNFGYIRRLGKPDERKRPGGAGVYWHISYYGRPHSYTWINTTAPALMWEELDKAWENDARTLWVLNVGDIKPMEIGVDYFSKLAWSPDAAGANSQPHFLRDFAAEQFGEKFAQPMADFLMEFYRLGTIRKPELMDRAWALSLSDERATQLRHDYENLLKNEQKLAATIPAEARDAYFEIIGFPADVLGASGLIFMADRAIQHGENAAPNEEEITRQRDFLEKQVARFNNDTAGGKWKHIMPGLVTGKFLTAWNSQVRWPWGEKKEELTNQPEAAAQESARVWRDAASADRNSAAGKARWTPVAGLGPTGRALALKPASLDSSWKENDKAAPTLEFNFEAKGGEGEEALIDFLPTFRIYPGMQLRVAVGLDDQPPAVVEVPGSSGKEDENGPNRNNGIQNNFVRAQVPLPKLSAGKHVLKIRAVDPGAVIDRICLPGKN